MQKVEEEFYMMPDKSQGGLLARLQDLSGCQYLSDLHSPFYIEDILYAVRMVSISSYFHERMGGGFPVYY